jgi:hypothetical protein
MHDPDTPSPDVSSEPRSGRRHPGRHAVASSRHGHGLGLPRPGERGGQHRPPRPASATTPPPRRRSRLVLGALVVALLTPFLVTASAASGAEVTVVVATDADAVADSAHPSRNYGTSKLLRADGSPVVRTYLHFSVGALDGTVLKAELLVSAKSTTASPTSVSTSAATWSERSLTYANAPAPSAPLATAPPVKAGGTLTADVTSAVTAPGSVGFVLSTASPTNFAMYSKESPSAPQARLRITVQQTVPAGSAATPTPSPTASTTPSPTASPSPSPSPSPTPTTTSQGAIRAAFYYPWFPEAWKQQGFDPFTRYEPSAGYYDSSATAIIDRHIDSMVYAGMDAGIASWWGQGSRTDSRISALLARAAGKPFSWALYYEPEGSGDPSPTTIADDLAYVKAKYASSPAYLKVGGKPVIFVYADPGDGCGMADRWAKGNASAGFHVVLKDFPGYTSCASQPDDWHQYAPANATQVSTTSYTVSPGFWRPDESSARLARDTARFTKDVAAMAASGKRWQLVTTWNEWGEGTAVESATQWSSPSGNGTYADILHAALAAGSTASPTPTPTTSPTPTPSPSPSSTPSGGALVAAVGDIACSSTSSSFNGGLGTSSSCHQQAVADLLAGRKLSAFLPLGDIQYECGDLSDFRASYDLTWHDFLDITRPAVGNHEYGTSCGRNDASGYFTYFGTRAGPDEHGWYSYDIGSWHLIALNSECSYGTTGVVVGGCSTSSPQYAWLKQDLAAHPNQCTLAYWHEPRWSSGEHGDAQSMTDIWNLLVTSGAELALAGHNHSYERFEPLGTAPKDTSASPSFQQPTPDPNGIRELVVGTGGKNHYGFSNPMLNGEVVRNGDTFGVLLLTLGDGTYSWQFVPEAGKTFTDSGSGVCH